MSLKIISPLERSLIHENRPCRSKMRVVIHKKAASWGPQCVVAGNDLQQLHLLLDLFKDERYRLKDRFKPVYYALMSRMQDEYPKEFKKMGEELRQTVEEILAESDKMALAYY